MTSLLETRSARKLGGVLLVSFSIVTVLLLASLAGTISTDSASAPVSPSVVPLGGGPFPVSFIESGLPSGAMWSVNLSGSLKSTSTTSLIFEVTPGSLTLNVAGPAGYGLARITGPHRPAELRVTVTAKSTFHLTFGPIETLSFPEVGLPSNSIWSVSIRPAPLQGTPSTQSAFGVVGSRTPWGVVFDPIQNQLYTVDSSTNTVNVISTLTNQIVAVDPVGRCAGFGIAYVPARSEVYEASYCVGPTNKVAVTAISTLTDTILSRFVVGNGGCGPAEVGAVVYDPAHGELFVPTCAGTVNVVNDTNDSVVATAPIPSSSVGGAYDRAHGEVFVSDFGANDVTVINDTNDSVVATIPVGGEPQGVVYDPAQGEIFVTNFDGGVSVVNDTSDTVVDTIPLPGGLQSLAYEPSTDQIYATSQGGPVEVIDANNDSVVANVSAGDTYGVAYDAASNGIYVAQGGGANVAEINASSGAITASIPFQGDTIGFTVVAGHWRYQALSESTSYRPVHPRGVVRVLATGLSKPIAFKLETAKVVFSEKGLPRGVEWGVNITGPLNVSLTTTKGSIAVLLPNGTYNYSLWNFSLRNPTPASGSFTVVVPHKALHVRVDYSPAHGESILSLAKPSATTAATRAAIDESRSSENLTQQERSSRPASWEGPKGYRNRPQRHLASWSQTPRKSPSSSRPSAAA